METLIKFDKSWFGELETTNGYQDWRQRPPICGIKMTYNDFAKSNFTSTAARLAGEKAREIIRHIYIKPDQ